MKTERMLRNIFADLNPFVCLIFYLAVIGFTAVLQHPVILMISLAGWIVSGSLRRGIKAMLVRFLRMLPLAVLAAVLNPLFSHQGVTVLTYLPGGNPLTLESLLYGAAAGLLMLDTLGWFFDLSETMTGEKWIYLFGRTIPALSLTLSMIFRFVPMLFRQIRNTHDALAQSEKDTDGKRGKLMLGLHTFSAVTSWALENAAETADSMKSRGFGSRKRTSYTRYEFDFRDATVLAFILLTGVGVYVMRPSWGYYPVFYMENSMMCALCFAILCFFPAMLGYVTDFRYELRIRRLKG